jgi:membrane protein DedA with SNARE-associated domain
MIIAIMTVVCFVLGAVWHSALFGKLWTRIHHGKDTLTPAELAKADEGLWKIMVAEFVATLLMVIGLACIVRAIPQYSGVMNAGLVWLAFVLPTMTSSVIWGNDAKKYMATKIAISSICRLIGLLVTGYVLGGM